jgi:beta-N-acetylhexosaminidase
VEAARQATKVIIAVYVVPTPAKQVLVQGKLANSVAVQGSSGELLRQILEIARPKTALIAMGNPYLAQSFPTVETYICTYSDASSSELAAVKLLFAELQPRGRLPVTLPGIAERGFSLPEMKGAARSRSVAGSANHN